MSTKIDDGYKLIAPINIFYKQAHEQLKQTFTRLLNHAALKHMLTYRGEIILHENNQLLYERLHPTLQEEITNKGIPHTKQWKEIILNTVMGNYPNLDYPAGQRNDSVSVYQHKTKRREQQQPAITFFWSDDTQQWLLITHIDIINPAYKELLLAWEQEKLIEPYPYWDNTDLPENITEEEWEQRAQIWEKALDLAAPYPNEGLTLNPITKYDWIPFLGEIVLEQYTKSENFPEEYEIVIREATHTLTLKTLKQDYDSDKSKNEVLFLDYRKKHYEAKYATMLELMREQNPLQGFIERR